MGRSGALAVTVPLHAQTTPSGDVSVQYSPLYVLKRYTIWINGVSASVERNVTNWLGLAGDLGVYHGHVLENLTGETYLVGPRFTYRKFEKFVPFAQDLFFQSLFGGSHFSRSTEASRAGKPIHICIWRRGRCRSWSHTEICPAAKVGIRRHSLGDSTTPSVRLSIGIVYRIGRH